MTSYDFFEVACHNLLFRQETRVRSLLLGALLQKGTIKESVFDFGNWNADRRRLVLNASSNCRSILAFFKNVRKINLSPVGSGQWLFI